MDQLMFSFFDLNIIGFKNVLADNGVFLGMHKMEFLGKLNTKFNQLKGEKIHGVGIHAGICLDRLPGCEMFEVRVALTEDLLDENGLFFAEPNSPKREGEVIIRFAFKLRNGKVVEIRNTRLFSTIQGRNASSGYNDQIIPN